MDTDRKLTDKTGKKPRTLSYKYSFRLNEEQNIRFNELLCKAGSEQFYRQKNLRRGVCRHQTRPVEDAVYCPAERVLFSISETGQ